MNEEQRELEPCNDPVVEAVIKDLRDRSRVGQEKYGTTLAREDLSLKDWLEHQYQELLDAANYTKRAVMEVDKLSASHARLVKALEMWDAADRLALIDGPVAARRQLNAAHANACSALREAKELTAKEEV